jgi:hypothetical protein
MHLLQTLLKYFFCNEAKKKRKKTKLKGKYYSRGKKVPIASFLRRTRTTYGRET